MLRKHLLASAAAVSLIMASGLAYAQSPAESKKDEPKKERVEKSEPVKAGESRSETKAPDKTLERTETGNEKNPPSRQAGEEHNKAATSSEHGAAKEAGQNRAQGENAKQNEHADESRRGTREEGNKAPAASQAEKPASEKSAQGTEKSKSGAASSERSESQRGETSKTSPAPSQQSSSQPGSTPPNKPAAANETDKNRTPNEAQRNTGTGSASSTATATSSGAALPRDKEIRISETMKRQELAAPERNLNVSITVGAEIPERVRLHRLPPEIVSIEPEYRDYDYFTTDDAIVIVEPRSHRIVSRIAKDTSRERAETGSAAVTANASGGPSAPCQIMRRDASGQLSEASSTTVGSSAGAQSRDTITVTVQTPDQRSTGPISLDAPSGQIVVATQGPGDCRVTIEPGVTR